MFFTGSPSISLAGLSVFVSVMYFPLPLLVPQGSILGPLLFVIFINDLNLLPLSPNSKVFLYADDLLLLHTISSQSDHSLQSDFDVISSVISSWFSSNRLSVNPSKLKYTFFSLKHQSYFDSIPLALLLSNIPFDRVYSFKYLYGPNSLL